MPAEREEYSNRRNHTQHEMVVDKDRQLSGIRVHAIRTSVRQTETNEEQYGRALKQKQRTNAR